MKTLFLALLFATTFFSCKKDFSFSGITADKTVLQVGDKANLTAVASGDGLKYDWNGPCGTKTADNSEIIYDAYGACCLGTHEISCTVKNGTKKETKKITITVQ